MVNTIMVQQACRACRKVESTHCGVHAAIVMVLNIDCGVDMNPHMHLINGKPGQQLLGG